MKPGVRWRLVFGVVLSAIAFSAIWYFLQKEEADGVCWVGTKTKSIRALLALLNEPVDVPVAANTFSVLDVTHLVHDELCGRAGCAALLQRAAIRAEGLTEIVDNTRFTVSVENGKIQMIRLLRHAIKQIPSDNVIIYVDGIHVVITTKSFVRRDQLTYIENNGLNWWDFVLQNGFESLGFDGCRVSVFFVGSFGGY